MAYFGSTIIRLGRCFWSSLGGHEEVNNAIMLVIFVNHYLAQNRENGVHMKIPGIQTKESLHVLCDLDMPIKSLDLIKELKISCPLS